MDGIGEGAWEVGRVGDQEVVLGDWHGDAADVSVLQGIGADEVAGDLAGDRDAGNRVHLCVEPGSRDWWRRGRRWPCGRRRYQRPAHILWRHGRRLAPAGQEHVGCGSIRAAGRIPAKWLPRDAEHAVDTEFFEPAHH